MSAIADLLQRVPFLGALTSEDREALAASVTHRRFRKGDIIFQREDDGQALFIVEGGSVRVYFPGAQGSDLTLALFGPGPVCAPGGGADPHGRLNARPTLR